MDLSQRRYRSCGTDLHSLFYCAANGVAVLGLVQMFHPICFYQVIAAAVVFIISNLILGILGLQPQGNISTDQLLSEFPVLFITFLAAIYALLKIPSLTNQIFSGSSGGSSASILGLLS